MFTVVLTNSISPEGVEFLRAQKELKVIEGKCDNVYESMDILREADAIIHRIPAKLSRDVLLKLPKLKAISRIGVGIDLIDIPTATELGIPVAVTPGANDRSVAEHVLALICCVTKCLPLYSREVLKGNFKIRNEVAPTEIENKTVAVLGFGNIGKVTANLLRANGMSVVVYNHGTRKQEVLEQGFEYEDDLYSALSKADVVSLHMPLTKDTANFIGAKEFSAMKKGSCLINCARGGIVDEDALYEALTDGNLAAAGVDVMKSEPFDRSSPLLTLLNFIATPHVAGTTNEAMSRVTDLACRAVVAILHGERWKYTVNPAAYDSSRVK